MYINRKRFIISIFLISFLVRILFGIYYFNENGTADWVDDWDYIQFAGQLIENNYFPLESEKIDAHAGPGYPLLVAFNFQLFGYNNYYALIILNAVLSALITILIYFIGKTAFSEKVAILASIWSIFYISFIRYVPRIIKENLNVFLFTLILLLFIHLIMEKRNKKSSIIWFSILFSYLIHVDERFFIYFPIFLLMGYIYKIKTSNLLYFFLIVILLMIPWSIRNYYTYNQIVILTERTTKFTYKIFGYDSPIHTSERNQADVVKLYESIADSLINGKEIKSEIRRVDDLKRGIELGYIPHTFTRHERWWAEFKEFWRPFRFSGGYVDFGYRFEGPRWSLKHNLAIGLTYGILLPFFLFGLYYIFYNKNKYGFLFLILIFSHTLVHVVLAHARNRYRIPIDPLIILISFYGLITFWEKLKQKYLKYE